MNGLTSIRFVVVGAIVALVTIAGIFVSVLALGHGFDSKTTPVITTVLGLIGTTITALLALLATIGIDRKVNGHIARLTTIATQAAAASGDPELAAKADEAVELATQSLGSKAANGIAETPP